MSIQRQYFVDLFLAKGAVGPLPHNTGAPSDALPMPKVFGAEEVSPDYLEVLRAARSGAPRVNAVGIVVCGLADPLHLAAD